MPVPPDRVAARHAAVRARLEPLGCDGLLVQALPNVAYLSGLTASAGLCLVGRERSILIGDSRYAVALREAVAEVTDVSVELVPGGSSYDETAARLIADIGWRQVAVEAVHCSVARWRWLEQWIGEHAPGGWLVPLDGLVEDSRVIKDAWELGRLREAGGRLSEVGKCILPKVLAGRTEREVAIELEAAIRRAGFDRVAFDTIVASGPNAALPHHRAGDRRIAAGDLVVVDFGGVLDGYAADLTRTVAVGRVPAEHRRWIEAVALAQAAAIEASRPGMAPEAVDQAARDVLAAHGLGERFGHGTGHGLGLEVHERPRIGQRRVGAAEPPLAAGMVFTVEPGVYVEGQGGVRIEDDVVLTGSGPERITDVPLP
jgi:Xaa-Pro aminopeptidase